MRYLLLFLLFVFPSCGFLRSLEKNSVRVGEVLAQVQQATTNAEAAYKQVVAAAAEADTDGDGKTTMAEWIAYAIAALGAGGVALSRKAKLDDQHAVGQVRNADSDKRKGKMEERLEKLESKA